MKVIEPGALVREAAEVLAPMWREVVVIGAAALQMHLAQGPKPRQSVPVTVDLDLIVTPTRDVDLAVEVAAAAEVVATLESAGLTASVDQHERGFTWVRDDLRIQLIRPFHPFPTDAARSLPANTHVSLLAAEEHRLIVAFNDAPDEPRLQAASAAALVALKQVAFGRTRPDGQLVERDYHDVYLLVSTRQDEVEATYRVAQYNVRSLVDKALATLAAGEDESAAAARQHAELTGLHDLGAHTRDIVRSAVFMQRRLADNRNPTD